MLDSKMDKPVADKERICWIAVAGIGMFLAYLLSYAQYLKYISFAYGDWDLAIYAQFCHKAWHGSFDSPLLGTSFFGNHLNLLLFAAVPLYAAASSPLCLLVLQAVMLAAAVFPLYALGRRSLGPVPGLVPVILYAANPAVHFSALNEFHPETFLPFLFLAAVNSAVAGSTAGLLLWSALCLLLKENVALVVVALGLYAVFVHKRRVGWVVGAAAAIYFVAAVLLVIPPLNKGMIGYYNVYPHFGSTPSEILLGVLCRPVTALKVLLLPEKIAYVAWLLGALLFLPLLGPRAALMAVPLALQHLLSSRPVEYHREYYYSMEILPPLLAATVFGLHRLLGLTASSLHRWILTLVCVACIAASVFLGPFAPDRHYGNINDFVMDYRDLEKQRLVDAVPPSESGAATFQFLPRLVNRPRLYSFHYAYTGHSILSSSAGTLPDDLSWTLVDFNDNITFLANYDPDSHTRINDFLATRHLHPAAFAEAMVLFARDIGKPETLWEEVDSFSTAADKAGVLPVLVGKEIELLACVRTDTARPELTELSLYWRSVSESRVDLQLEIDLLDGSRRLFNAKRHPVGYRMWPVRTWKPGSVYRERVRLVVPPATSSLRWTLRVGFNDMVTRERLPANSACAESVDEENRVLLLEGQPGRP